MHLFDEGSYKYLVAIVHLVNDTIKLVCAGGLITPTEVFTACGCVLSSTNGKFHERKTKVILEKNIDDFSWSKAIDVIDIYSHEQCKTNGQLSNFGNLLTLGSVDTALIELEINVKMKRTLGWFDAETPKSYHKEFVVYSYGMRLKNPFPKIRKFIFKRINVHKCYHMLCKYFKKKQGNCPVKKDYIYQNYGCMIPNVPTCYLDPGAPVLTNRRTIIGVLSYSQCFEHITEFLLFPIYNSTSNLAVFIKQSRSAIKSLSSFLVISLLLLYSL